jgi:hypothetical protein
MIAPDEKLVYRFIPSGNQCNQIFFRLSADFSLPENPLLTLFPPL